MKKVLMRIELMSIKDIERKKESAIYNDLSDRVKLNLDLGMSTGGRIIKPKEPKVTTALENLLMSSLGVSALT